MFEHMRKKSSPFGPLAILVLAVIVGILISNLVLSLSAPAGFALIFAASTLIIVVIELSASYRRRSDGYKRHTLALYLERRRHARRGRQSDETLLESEPEIIDSVQHGWIQ